MGAARPGPIELVQTPNGWRIDRPSTVFLDWQQFQSAYKRVNALLSVT